MNHNEIKTELEKEYAVYIKNGYGEWEVWTDRFDSEDECEGHIQETIKNFEKERNIWLTEDDFMYREMTREEIEAYQ